MLAILLNWSYIGITAFCLGSGFSVLSGKLFGYGLKRLHSVLMAGLVIATVYCKCDIGSRVRGDFCVVPGVYEGVCDGWVARLKRL